MILLAGIAWSAVGIALIMVAIGWLHDIHRSRLIAIGIGIVAGVAVHRFGFSRLAAINLGRIRGQSPGKDRVCVFAFQNWKSYLMIAVMMTMGYALRHSPVPKIYLVPIYLAIGLALIFSSFSYYQAIR